mmetsp:Transcript_21501/g.52288  ORF Transcript_21501/g.52288 Transcript_21501/m.52288 type:complete len:699 (+) Transcript_21501:29-2125(+)
MVAVGPPIDVVSQEVEALHATVRKQFGNDPEPWVANMDGHPIDVVQATGLPQLACTALYLGKCKDHKIAPTPSRRQRFADVLLRSCQGPCLKLEEAGIAKECAKGVAIALLLSDSFHFAELAKNHIGDQGAASIAQVLPLSRTLVYLDVSANDIGPTGAKALFEGLAQNQSVVSLAYASLPGLHRNTLGPSGSEPVGRLLRCNPVLTKLVLTSTSIGEGIVHLAEGLAHNTTLLELHLGNNDLGARGFAALGPVVPKTSLEHLDLRDNRGSDQGVVALLETWKEHPGMPLQVLFLGGNDLSWVAVRQVCYFMEVSQLLRDVKLDRNVINPERMPVAFSKGICDCQALRRLVLGSCSLRVGFIADLCELLPRLQLQHLDLSGNPIDDPTAQILGRQLRTCTTLKSLDLATCRLTDQGGIDVADGLLENRTLEFVSLRDNNLHVASGQRLAEALDTNMVLLKMPLDLNAIEFKNLVAIKKALDRNRANRRAQLPNQLRNRIEDLKDKQAQVGKLAQEREANATAMQTARARKELAEECYHRTADEHSKLVDAAAADLDQVRGSKMRAEAEIATLKQEIKDLQSHWTRRERQYAIQHDELSNAIAKLQRNLTKREEELKEFEQDGKIEMNKLLMVKEQKARSLEATRSLLAKAERTYDLWQNGKFSSSALGTALPPVPTAKKTEKEAAAPKKGGKKKKTPR